MSSSPFPLCRNRCPGRVAFTARRGLALVRDAPGNDYKTNWGAAHPGGVQFIFGDGSVRLITYETGWDVFTKLLTLSAGDIASP